MIFFLWDCEQTSVDDFSSEKRKKVTLSTMHASNELTCARYMATAIDGIIMNLNHIHGELLASC